MHAVVRDVPKELNSVLKSLGDAVTPQLFWEVQDVLHDANRAPLTVLQDLQRIAEREGFGYTQPSLKASMFLVHECNRNWLMLDWYASHQVLSEVKSAGGCLQKTAMSHAVEIPTDKILCDRLVDRNKELVANAKGHLAPVNGRENTRL